MIYAILKLYFGYIITVCKVRHQNPDKFQFKFLILYIVPLSEVVIRENLMLLVNSYILKMVAMLKPSAEFRRAEIIEGLRAERSATEIIRFFGHSRSTIYDVVYDKIRL